ncbi:unnamed protein product [Clonostachys rosea]|uniref:Peptidase S8/S53 domain-containing protein n=1 Tax=Bionectria ochroleuca TaxID=29856 RepID=A0ABY6U2P9_BIOOC|nr:unnamed protein product [Clonostachys rosea]
MANAAGPVSHSLLNRVEDAVRETIGILGDTNGNVWDPDAAIRLRIRLGNFGVRFSILRDFEVTDDMKQDFQKLMEALRGISDSLYSLSTPRRSSLVEMMSSLGNRRSEEVSDPLAKAAHALEPLEKMLASDGAVTAYLESDRPFAHDEEVASRLSCTLFRALQPFLRCNASCDASGVQKASPLHRIRICLADIGHNFCTVIVSNQQMRVWRKLSFSSFTTCNDVNTHFEIKENQGYVCNYLSPGFRFHLIALNAADAPQLIDIDYKSGIPGLPEGGGMSLAQLLKVGKLCTTGRIQLVRTLCLALWEFFDDKDVCPQLLNSHAIFFMVMKTTEGEPVRYTLEPFIDFPVTSTAIGCPMSSEHKMSSVAKLLLEIVLWDAQSDNSPSSPSSAEHDTKRAARGLLDEFCSMEELDEYEKGLLEDAVSYCLGKSEEKSFLRWHFFREVVKRLIKLSDGCKAGESPLSILVEPPQPTPPPSPSKTHSCGQQLQTDGRTRQWILRNRQIGIDIFGLDDDAREIRAALLDSGCCELQGLGPKSLVYHSCLPNDVPGTDRIVPRMDKIGHGSFLAAAGTEITPNAEFAMVRISEGQPTLSTDEGYIVNGIYWAAREFKADIISMSFGFQSFSQPISDAIWNVHNERKGKIVFLACSGKDPSAGEIFPARHANVLSIFRTNIDGVPVGLNPIPEPYTVPLGTVGEFPFPQVLDAFAKSFPGLETVDTSVSTVVAAAMVAQLIRYESAMRRRFKSGHEVKYLEKLRGTNGIKAVFRAMVKDTDKKFHFFDMVHFWHHLSSGVPLEEVHRHICAQLRVILKDVNLHG